MNLKFINNRLLEICLRTIDNDTFNGDTQNETKKMNVKVFGIRDTVPLFKVKVRTSFNHK